jgi:hypothetical protein
MTAESYDFSASKVVSESNYYTPIHETVFSKFSLARIDFL